jgi:GR25 family glycosyltransferase involved in LPS biosynthesis
MCNRKKEKSRYDFLCRHFPSRGIPLEKINWVQGPWGSELTAEKVLEVYNPFQARFGLSKEFSLCFKSDSLTRGEISLCITFYETMKAAVACDSEWVLIFESDVFLREDFLSRLQDVLKNDSADYISLGEGVGTRPDGCYSYYAPTKLYDPPHQWVFRCCDSMLFRRSFLEKVLQTFIPFRECLDWELNLQMLAHRGKSLWVDPPLAEPGSGRWRNPTNLTA